MDIRKRERTAYVQRSFTIGSAGQWRRGVDNGADTFEGCGVIGRRNVRDFDSLKLRIFLKGLL